MQPGLIFFFKILFIYFREREGKRNRETLIGCLLYLPQPGTKPSTKACALTGSRTGDLLLQDDTQPTEPHQSGPGLILRELHSLRVVLPECATPHSPQELGPVMSSTLW